MKIKKNILGSACCSNNSGILYTTVIIIIIILVITDNLYKDNHTDQDTQITI